METNGGGYLPRCKVAREISTTFVNTEVNIIVLINSTKNSTFFTVNRLKNDWIF